MQTIIVISTSATNPDLVLGRTFDNNKVQLRYAIIQDLKTRYWEIIKAETPGPILKTLSIYYPDYLIWTVLKGDDNTFKLEIRNGEVWFILLFNEFGQVIKTTRQVAVI